MSKRPKYIIGVDAALRNVGVAVYDNMWNRIAAFNITTKSGMHDHNSVDHIVEVFFEKLEPYLPYSAIILEDAIFQSRGKGTARAEVVGAIKWNLRQMKLNIYGVAPNTLWSFICADFPPEKKKLNTDDKKKWTMLYVHQMFNFWTENDNIADAVCLARFGYSMLIEGRRLTYRALCQITN